MVHIFFRSGDAWIDVHNPAGSDCDDADDCHGEFESSAGAAVPTDFVDKHVKGKGDACIKFKSDGKMEGKSCGSSYRAVCESDCGGEQLGPPGQKKSMIF